MDNFFKLNERYKNLNGTIITKPDWSSAKKIVLALTIFLSILPVNYYSYCQETEFSGIHQIEHNYYKNQHINFEKEKSFRKPIPLQKRTAIPIKTVFGYHPYWMNSAYPNYNYNLLSTIAYFGVDVDSYGNISDRNGWPLTGLINLAHGYGVKVVLVAINFNSNSLTTLLSSSTNRTRLVNNLLNEVTRGNGDGINIDFERLPSSQQQNLNLFMRALADTFHTHIPHSSVSMALPAVNWGGKFDYYTLATICDALFIMGYNYHWSGSSNAGPVAPLTGWGTYNITWTVQDYLSATGGQKEKIVLGLPYYGIKWATSSSARGAATISDGTAIRYDGAESEAHSKGKLWDAESQTPWYRYQSGNWYQVWYDDSLSLSLKYQLALNEDLQGIGMWALGYDGSRPELWGALRDLLGSSTPPPAIADFRVENIGGGTIRLKSSPSPDASGYRVYIATGRNAFRLQSTLAQPQVTYSNLSSDSSYFFKMTAYNQFGESPATEVLAASRADRFADILIVNGFDRATVAGNSRDFVIEHGSAIKAAGHSFDSASNEAIVNGSVDIQKYKIVDWILGQESTADETFSIQEQGIVKNFLKNGGKLFVSGSEIAWDLDYKGSASDQDFYHNFLKAIYVADKVDDYNLNGTSESIFSGVSFSYGDGSHGVYRVGYPDAIDPAAGAIVCLKYNNDFNAGIQFTGIIGEAETRIVNLGIPFETIYPESSRNELMARIISFFNEPTAVTNDREKIAVPDRPALYQNYPNPFNQTTVFRFFLPADEKVSLTIFNIRGEIVKTLYQNEELVTGVHRIEWNGVSNSGENLASGVYFYRLATGNFISTKRLIYLK